MLGNVRQVFEKYQKINHDGFWTTMPLVVRHVSTGSVYSFPNAGYCSKRLAIPEAQLVYALYYRHPVQGYRVTLDEAVLQKFGLQSEQNKVVLAKQK